VLRYIIMTQDQAGRNPQLDNRFQRPELSTNLIEPSSGLRTMCVDFVGWTNQTAWGLTTEGRFRREAMHADLRFAMLAPVGAP